MTGADELSSSVSEDTGFCSAPPLSSDPLLDLCDLPDSQDPPDPPQEELDPAPPPTPAHDTPPGYLCEDEPHQELTTTLPPLPDSPRGGSVCEEDVTLALKELDERCEEEEADFSDMSR